MPLWLILIGGGALVAYLVSQGKQQASSTPTAVITSSVSQGTTKPLGLVEARPGDQRQLYQISNPVGAYIRDATGAVQMQPTGILPNPQAIVASGVKFRGTPSDSGLIETNDLRAFVSIQQSLSDFILASDTSAIEG
jgi:hypothetical protein